MSFTAATTTLAPFPGTGTAAAAAGLPAVFRPESPRRRVPSQSRGLLGIFSRAQRQDQTVTSKRFGRRPLLSPSSGTLMKQGNEQGPTNGYQAYIRVILPCRTCPGQPLANRNQLPGAGSRAIDRHSRNIQRRSAPRSHRVTHNSGSDKHSRSASSTPEGNSRLKTW